MKHTLAREDVVRRIFFLTVCCVVVVVTSARAGSPENRPLVREAEGASPPLFTEISKLFQGGKERVDLEIVKKLLVECTEMNERIRPTVVNSQEEFFESADRLMEYFDSHRLDASDIVALREWEADSFDCRDDEKNGFQNALSARIRRALGRVWDSVVRGEGGYEPRHAILADVLSQPAISLPGLVNLARVIQRRQRGEQVPNDSLGMEIQGFLLAPENKALWEAVVRDTETLDRSRTGPGHFENADRVDALLKEVGGARDFNGTLAEFIQQSEKLLKAYPGYAMPERLYDILAMRVVWNIVQAHGNDQAKANYREYIERLREFFATRSDRVTVKWLDQVMEKPGKPPESFVVRLQLGEPEEQSEQKVEK